MMGSVIYPGVMYHHIVPQSALSTRGRKTQKVSWELDELTGQKETQITSAQLQLSVSTFKKDLCIGSSEIVWERHLMKTCVVAVFTKSDS